jgi:hypothetical protein
VSGDRSHPRDEGIGQMLGLLMHEMARYGCEEYRGSCLDGD